MSDVMEKFYENYRELEQEVGKDIDLDDLQLEVGKSTCRLMRVQSLTYEEKFPRLEAFENVVASLNNKKSRLIYYLRGTEAGAEFYIGVAEDEGLGGNIRDLRDSLERAFKGNFLGSGFYGDDIEKREALIAERQLTAKLQENLKSDFMKYSIVLGLPSKNNDKEAISFQGIDRLVNIMNGIPFHLIVVGEPMEKYSIEVFDRRVKEIYSQIESKQSIQTGTSTNTSQGTSWQKGTSSGSNETIGTNQSDSFSHSSGGSSKDSTSHSKGGSESRGTNKGESESQSGSTTEGTGTSSSTTVEQIDKKMEELKKYVDEQLLPRLGQGRAKGMYCTAVYLGAEMEAHLSLLENAVTSIFQGDKSTFYPLQVQRLPENPQVKELVSSFAIYKTLPATSSLWPLCSRPVINFQVPLGTCLTAGEISILAGLPQKEVPGLELREQVSFGLNVPPRRSPNGDQIDLGYVYQEGTALKENRVCLSKKELSKHAFIAGTTGSGKTTTCLRLLEEAQLPFLVVEPAKTEYRVLVERQAHSLDKLDEKDKIVLFTVNREDGVPFRFNPFEFLPTENLSGHVDMLKASFMASFDMEAAIPNLLEEALYKIYLRFGWNFRDNSNRFLQNRADAWAPKTCGMFFPTISDYVRELEKVVAGKGFDERLKNDYLGSLKARLDSLRAGSKKIMFDTRLSVDFEKLLDRKVIIELEELKSGEDKSFIMGLILGRLAEALKARHGKDATYKHITLVEEAHRLLSRPQPGDSPNRRMGVEMFADLLAEVRKYGESLIIVDQIPGKLAPEVLKNTNTKIIHKLFARDDKEAVGDTMALDEKQRNYLSHLLPGEAIIFSQGWKKPVDVQIEEVKGASTTETEITEQLVFESGWKYWCAPEISWRYCPACQEATEELSPDILRERESCYLRIREILSISDYAKKAKQWLDLLARARKSFAPASLDMCITNCLNEAFLQQNIFEYSTTQDGYEEYLQQKEEFDSLAPALVAVSNVDDAHKAFQSIGNHIFSKNQN